MIDWLPSTVVPDVVIGCEDEYVNKFLKNLELREIESINLLKRVDSISPVLTIPERASILAGLLREQLLSDDYVLSLLIDQEGAIISRKNIVFYRRLNKLN